MAQDCSEDGVWDCNEAVEWDYSEAEEWGCKVEAEDGKEGWQSKVGRRGTPEGCLGFDNDNCTVQACCPPYCNSHNCKVSCTAHALDSGTFQHQESSDRTETLAPAASEPG